MRIESRGRLERRRQRKGDVETYEKGERSGPRKGSRSFYLVPGPVG